MYLRRRRNLLLLVLLLGAAVLSWWLLSQVRISGEVEDRAQVHRPDFFLDDFILRVMDEAGRPKHKVEGTRLVHYPDDDTAEVDDPYMEIYRPQAPDWQISARFAWIGPGGEQVRLQREVVVERVAEADVAPMTMLTEELLALPDDEYVETDLPVRFLGTGWDVTAIGMRGWLGEGRMELLSEVRGVHEPRK
jgi:lipopolysaccharide export system protein LptC